MSDEELEVTELEVPEIPEPDPLPPTPCPFCGQTGQVFTGWDEDGNDTFVECGECGGTGVYDYGE